MHRVSIWGQSRVNLGYIWGQSGVNLVSICDNYGSLGRRTLAGLGLLATLAFVAEQKLGDRNVVRLVLGAQGNGSGQRALDPQGHWVDLVDVDVGVVLLEDLELCL